MKIWVVKYALTAGIRVYEGEVDDRSIATVHDEKALNKRAYYHGKNRDWCDNEEDAIRCAKALRQKKLESLRKQIAKLEKLSFEGEKE